MHIIELHITLKLCSATKLTKFKSLQGNCMEKFDINFVVFWIPDCKERNTDISHLKGGIRCKIRCKRCKTLRSGGLKVWIVTIIAAVLYVRQCI